MSMTSHATLFQPEVVLPAQLTEGRHAATVLQPEKRLMLAVLEEAVTTLQRFAVANGRGARRRFTEAHVWLSSDDARWPFSFFNVCHALDLEPECVRRGLERWLASARAATPRGRVVPLRYIARHTSGTRTRPVVLRSSRR